MDGQKELLVSFQGVPDSLTHTSYTWNANTSQYDTTVSTVANQKPWAFIILENSTAQLDTDEPVTFITPEQYRLAQNYPNPFNPETWIPFQLRNNSIVTIKIYSTEGYLVRQFNLGQKLAGRYLSQKQAVYWNGKSQTGETMGSGTYFYQLQAGDYIEVRKMLILK